MELVEESKDGNLERVKNLLKEGVDINFLYDKWTPLIGASQYGHLEIVKLLLENGADINLGNKIGWNPLLVASRNSNTTSNVETVKELLKYGADVDLRTNKGWTALMMSARYSNTDSNVETVKELLKYGADFNLINNGWTALMMAARYSNTTSNVETVRELLKYGPDLLKNNDGWTALMVAASNSNGDSNIETVRELLKYNANPFAKNNDGKIALDLCPTKECNALIGKYMWDWMYQNVKRLSKQYSRSGTARFPKDIWELILLRNKQKQLCKRLSNEENKYILVNFALLLDIPISENMTKRTLCDLISKQLGYGGKYSQKSENYFKNKESIQKVVALGQSLGINTSQPVEKILSDISDALMR